MLTLIVGNREHRGSPTPFSIILLFIHVLFLYIVVKWYWGKHTLDDFQKLRFFLLKYVTFVKFNYQLIIFLL